MLRRRIKMMSEDGTVEMELAFDCTQDILKKLYVDYFDTFDVLDEWCAKDNMIKPVVVFDTALWFLEQFEVDVAEDFVCIEFIEKMCAVLERMSEDREYYLMMEGLHAEMFFQRMAERGEI